MLIFLAFLFLLTPFPILPASVGERKNSTKTAPHTTNTLLNIKQKTPTLSSASKINNVSQTMLSPTMPPETPSIKKPSKDKPPSSPPIKVVITEGCTQKEPQKETIDSSKTQETELSVKPGSPFVMTHHISLLPGSCTGGCESEMAALKGRVKILEQEMSALKKKWAIKETRISSDSTTINQETSSLEQSKTNTTIVKRKDKEGMHQGQANSLPTVEESPLNKDLLLNRSVTQRSERKSNGNVKVSIKLPKGTKESVNKTVEKNSEKEKSSLSNVTFTGNEKKPSKDSINLSIGGKSVIQILEKQANVTEGLKGRDKTQQKAHEKNVLVKQDVTASTNKKPIKENVIHAKEKKTLTQTSQKHSSGTNVTLTDKKPSQPNRKPLKEGSTNKKQLEKHSNDTSFIDKDRKFRPSNSLPEDGSSRRRIVDRYLNDTVANNKKLFKDGETTSHTKATSGNRKVETRVNVTASTENRTQDNVTPPQEASLGKTKVGKHLNVTNSTENDRREQISATPLKEKTSGMKNVSTSSEKRKKLPPGNETKASKVTQGKKTVQKLVNTTTSTRGGNKLHQRNVTLREESLRNAKLDSHHNSTIATERDSKKLPQNTEMKILTNVSAEKKSVEKHLNVTTFSENDSKLSKGNGTLLKEGSPQKGKVNNINVKKSNENVRTFLQGDEITGSTKVISPTEVKDANVTVSSVEGKHVYHSLKEEASRKNKVNSDLKIITDSQNYANRTTKFTDIRHVQVHNITATGFVITWDAPQGLFRNFTVTRREVRSERGSDDGTEEEEKIQDGDGRADELHISNRTSSKVYPGNADRISVERFSQTLPGSARSYHFKNLRPQRKYSVSLFSSGPHVRSKVHRVFVSTGPEPPTELLFSNITETSLTVSWTKPKSTVTGYKVTYTSSANGVTGSMSVDSQLSHVLISKLSVGSQYEISVSSVMGAIESEATTASVVTVPDSPADFQAVNVTDTKALLVWKPAQAKVDYYVLSYKATGSPNVVVTVMVSGKSMEHQLKNLHRSTLYSAKIMSQVNSLTSRSVSTTFTTISGVKVQLVTPSVITWNSALISWKSTHLSFRSYRLIYQFGEEIKEVILNPTVTHYELTDLVESTHYTVKVDGENEGQYIRVVSTAFTTAQLPYPYPAECSQVQMNGMKKSGEAEIYPDGKDGEAVWVYCDVETDGGGWTVFQRRVDGFTDFFREWKDYSVGFGEMSAEFWLGNEILHMLTSMEPMSLRIDLRLGNDTAYAHYSNFSVESEENHYTINLSGYSGTAGDSMRYHSGCPFSTKDKQPSTITVHCAKNYMGGWWYKNCYKANLNGVYATFSKDQGVVWIDWKGKDISLPFTEMKLRPASLNPVTVNTQG